MNFIINILYSKIKNNNLFDIKKFIFFIVQKIKINRILKKIEKLE